MMEVTEMASDCAALAIKDAARIRDKEDAMKIKFSTKSSKELFEFGHLIESRYEILKCVRFYENYLYHYEADVINVDASDETKEKAKKDLGL